MQLYMVYTYIHIYIHVYTNIYIYICIYKYTHKYIHTNGKGGSEWRQPCWYMQDVFCICSCMHSPIHSKYVSNIRMAVGSSRMPRSIIFICIRVQYVFFVHVRTYVWYVRNMCISRMYAQTYDAYVECVLATCTHKHIIQF